MPLEIVTLTVSGKPLPHKSCVLNCGAEEVERDATFEVAYNGPGIPCEKGEPATVHIGGELWLTGEVRDMNPSHDESERNYSVALISRTCDASECSVDHAQGIVENVDLMEIARTFDTAGVGVEGDVVTPKKRTHKVITGETLIDTIEPDAAALGILIYDTPEGNLKLADKPEGRHSGTLKRGENIKSASANLSSARDFSKVKGRGQNSHGTNATSFHPDAVATNPDAKRERVLIVAHQGEATKERLKQRVKWEAKRAAGNGTTASIVTPDWRDDGGKIWDRNFLVSVDDDWIGVQQDMVTAQVSLSQDADGGTEATLNLKDPRALGGQNPRGKSAGSWAAPGDAAADYKEQAL
ncbi:MAG: hypothetical protein AAFO61_11445 [Pseudomonadota bacterium]